MDWHGQWVSSVMLLAAKGFEYCRFWQCRKCIVNQKEGEASVGKCRGVVSVSLAEGCLYCFMWARQCKACRCYRPRQKFPRLQLLQ